ncbi:hypothetical protein FH972_010332 [Carpinus fangiana]|uniref:Uncharacterized protein n=1 Tax=Carpinus fangiana TaxID=176857 RepID=A0A660KU18_9ROSI|nr:hypothetical protein FH972_010332 [Carpinus fangiana]
MALMNLIRSLLFLGLVLTIVFSNKALLESNLEDIITSDVPLNNNIGGKKLLNYTAVMLRSDDVVDQIIHAYQLSKARMAHYPRHAFFLL